MKKLFAMILLLAFSLPALAGEVRLVCKMGDGSEIDFSFHTEPDYYDERNKRCGDKRKSCEIIDVSDIFVSVSHYDSEGKYTSEYVDRGKGTYRGEEGRGKCVKFTQVF